MKVLIFSHEYPPLGGGAGVVASQLVKHFYEDTSIEFVDVLTRYNGVQEPINNVRNVFMANIHNKIWPLEYFCYCKLNIDFDEYDIIVCNDLIAIYMAGMMLSKKNLARTICFLHGSEPEFVYQNITISKRLLCMRHFFHRALSYCNYVGSHSVFMKEKFINLVPCKYSISPDKIIPLYFGYDDELFNINNKALNRREIRNKYQFSDDDVIILTVSRVEEKKGFPTMLNAFEVMRDGNNKIKWMIIGDGDYLTHAKKIAHEKNMDKSIIFTGKIKRNHLCAYYNAADLFWLLSEYKEAFGLVYMEAQASGIPAIGYNDSGVKEAIDNGTTGFLINKLNEVYDIIKLKEYEKIDRDKLILFSKGFSSKHAYKNILRHFNGKGI